MKKTVLYSVTVSGLIAALYTVLTYICILFGLSFGPIQLRVSEVMTLLPVFTPAAIPGLAVGCLVSNIASPYGLADILFGTVATLLAAITSRLLRKVKLFGFPVLSALMPVIFNAVIIGAEIAIITPGESTGFLFTALTVGAGEALVCLVLGIPFYFIIDKYKDSLFNRYHY